MTIREKLDRFGDEIKEDVQRMEADHDKKEVDRKEADMKKKKRKLSAMKKSSKS